MEIVFATNNIYKLREIKQLVSGKIKILSLNDIQCFDDLPETHTTLEENAKEKALYIHQKYKLNCFADDTGLEIDALAGRPGVFSARYAGDDKSSLDNISKVLREMENITNRRAQFRTVISLIMDGTEKKFEGAVKGIILREMKGEQGFGYDPIFQADGYTKSFAEMSAEEKNLISHRAIATQKLIEYLNVNLI